MSSNQLSVAATSMFLPALAQELNQRTGGRQRVLNARITLKDDLGGKAAVDLFLGSKRRTNSERAMFIARQLILTRQHDGTLAINEPPLHAGWLLASTDSTNIEIVARMESLLTHEVKGNGLIDDSRFDVLDPPSRFAQLASPDLSLF